MNTVYNAFQRAGVDLGDGAPALVSLMLDRRKMDGNRARGPCCEPLTNITGLPGGVAQGECAAATAEELAGAPGAWDAYHGWLAEALAAAVARHGFCLLLDLHGQSHRKGVSELGYLLTSEDLLLPDDSIDAAPPRPSSIDALLQLPSPGVSSLAGLVRGPASLGAFLVSMKSTIFTMKFTILGDEIHRCLGLCWAESGQILTQEARGFPCVPSPRAPQPVELAA